MTASPQDALCAAVADLMPLASQLFGEIGDLSRDEDGVSRAAWSRQDQAAADRLSQAARDLGLASRTDAAGNLYMDLSGSDPSAPGVLSGSHLDSVARGGNFDGLAGAVAALVALAAIKKADIAPRRRLSAMGIRGEESVWYGIAYLGSRLAVGAMERSDFDTLVRLDTGRPLSAHMVDLGLDPAAIWQQAPAVNAANTAAFLELHIEQGPLLEELDKPLAVATAIRGNLRHVEAVCLGAYQHSAAAPRRSRRDAVLAVTELLSRLEALWHKTEDDGDRSAVFTVGKLFTDPDHHAMTKVPGECRFSLNFGSTEQATLDRAAAAITELTAEIAERRGVNFVLGDAVGSPPTPLDPGLQARLSDTAARLEIPSDAFATVGHDASIFARAGIPSAVLLVRNSGGSHNPGEGMALADFERGVAVLAATMADLGQS